MTLERRARIEQSHTKIPKILVVDDERSILDLLRQIKRARPASHKKPTTIVIMLTNHASPEYQRACEEAAAEFFFDKSFGHDQLVATHRQLGQQFGVVPSQVQHHEEPTLTRRVRLR